MYFLKLNLIRSTGGMFMSMHLGYYISKKIYFEELSIVIEFLFCISSLLCGICWIVTGLSVINNPNKTKI